jgi:hypothetical protein
MKSFTEKIENVLIKKKVASINNKSLREIFSFTKKILMLPELLYFIYSNEELMTIVISLLKADLGQSVEVDIFMIKCGLCIDSKQSKSLLKNLHVQ